MQCTDGVKIPIQCTERVKFPIYAERFHLYFPVIHRERIGPLLVTIYKHWSLTHKLCVVEYIIHEAL